MPRGKSSRKYQLTINNPLEHGWTHETSPAASIGVSATRLERTGPCIPTFTWRSATLRSLPV